MYMYIYIYIFIYTYVTYIYIYIYIHITEYQKESKSILFSSLYTMIFTVKGFKVIY